MRRLKEIYADSGIVVRTRAPQLFVVLSVVIAILPVLVLNDFLSGDYGPFALEVLIEIIMVFSLVMLFRGHFRLASTVPLIIATAALIALAALIEVESRGQVYTAAMYLLPALLFSLVVSESPWQTAAVAVAGLVTVISVSLLKIAPGLKAINAEVRCTEQIVIVSVIYILISFFSVLVSWSNRRALQELETAARQTRETLDRIVEVNNKARSSVSSSQSVESKYSDVRENASRIREQIGVLERSITNLRENVANVLGSVRATSDRILGFHAQVDEQNTVVQESTASINEMSASLDSVAQITAGRKESSEKLLEVASEGLSAIEETSNSFQTARNEMASLLEINEIIGDIASQTNLLSMNAAIEAAHAGEAGKGFAVVADEIRKLAGSTGENSQTISNNLKRLMDSITKTSDHVVRTKTAMSRISDEVREVAGALDEITGSTAELSQGGREVLNAMQVLQTSSAQVRDGSDQIARDQQSAREEMDRIGKVVEAMENAASEVAHAVESINNSMGYLHKTIAESSSQSESLHHSIAHLVDGLK